MTYCRRSLALRSFVQALAVAALGFSLLSPAAQAAGHKKDSAPQQPAKKTSTAKTKAKPAPVRAALQRSAIGSRHAKVKAPAPQPRTVVAKTRLSKRAMAIAAAAAAAAAIRPSFGELAGLHNVSDPLDLKSSVALVIDQDTHEVLLRKNDHAVLPIASLTKLMTGLIISQAQLPMDEPITITEYEVDTEKGSHSRLTVGTTLSRREMLHLALMSSENRAAHALGRTYPGGMAAFVGQMNAKARTLGMADTRYVEPTGLSSNNQSSAHDLAVLVNVAHSDPLLREFSTSPGYEVAVGAKTLQYNNTNRLVKNPTWDIGLQKTGYIAEAGRCLVMQTQIAGRKLIMVFLDSAGKFSRLGDAERVRNWVESMPALRSAVSPIRGGNG